MSRNAGPDAAPAGGDTVAWFHCFSGIAGDMALGSLVDAGADLDEVRRLLERVPITGWDLRVEPTLRGGIACTRALVRHEEDGVIVRTHAHIVGLIAEARLPARVERRALAVFARLAEVEGRLHRRSPEQVHFHEIGGHDAVVDIVGTVAALEVLGVDRVAASPVATGTGMVRSAHGLLPNPAPATVRLLEGAPTYGRDLGVELTTPTGAALLAALSSGFGPLPPLRVERSGFGAGGHDLDELPNCTQVVVGTQARPGVAGGQPVSVVEANLDDVTGEQLSAAIDALLEAGAHDAWVSAAVMKKGRPGHTVHALADPALVPALRDVLRVTTGTFGVRAYRAERWPSARSTAEVAVAEQSIRIKVGRGRAKPEFDDVAAVAARTGLPLHEVTSLAEEAWRRSGGADGDPRVPPDGEPA